jgi:hypothetical protein
VKAQGWYRDPYRVHEDRYFSDGHPTKLVRDGGAESYDPPPPGPPEAELVEVPSSNPPDASDLRRADQRPAAIYEKHGGYWAAMNYVASYGPIY